MSNAKWATCNACHNSMTPAGTCTVEEYARKDKQGGVKRLPFPADSDDNCHDCNVASGKLHHVGCDMELCSLCGNQTISCDCEEY